MKATIYHNPRCSKSRRTLELLREHGIEPEIIEYLRTPPDAQTLRRLLDLLGVEPLELVRRSESEFAESGLEGASPGPDVVIRALCRHPRLLQRPIFVLGQQARIGRPPERVLELLPDSR